MKNSLNLEYSTTSTYSIFPSVELETQAETLLKLKDFKDRLRHYNDQICSLANSQAAIILYKYGNYNRWHGHGEVWYKANPKEETDDLQIFLEERQNELDQLKKLIAREKTYAGKLKAFLEDKAGQIRVEELQAAKNDYLLFSVKGGGIVPNHLLDSYYEIDLTPNTKEERKVYNDYVYDHVQRMRKNPEQFHTLLFRKYEGFDIKEAMPAFTRQIQNALDPDQTLRRELKRIEIKFEFGTMEDYIKTLYLSATHFCRMPETFQSSLFNANVNGLDVDLGNIECDLDDMMQLIHIEEITGYYRKLYSLKGKPLQVIDKEEAPTDKLSFRPQYGLNLIRPELQATITDLEIKMIDKVNKWKSGTSKIECAGFVELLHERSYFESKKSKVSTMTNFALTRYGMDIRVQLQPAKRAERKTHKQRLLRYFL